MYGHQLMCLEPGTGMGMGMGMGMERVPTHCHPKYTLQIYKGHVQRGKIGVV